MRVLVTGAAGFAGSGLLQELRGRGHDAVGLDIIAPDELPFEAGEWRWQAVQDVRARDLRGFDVLVHLAAQADVPMGYPSPTWTFEQNVMGTVHLLQAATEAGVGRFLYAGTAHELEGAGEVVLDERTALNPTTPYGASKAAAELACWAWQHSYGLPVVVMSNGVVVGPGMRRAIFLYRWFEQLRRGDPLVLEGDGSQGRDLTYVSDVVQAWVLAVEGPAARVEGQKFQVSYGQEYRMSDLLQMTLRRWGAPPVYPIEQRPDRPGEKGMREIFDISKARTVLGYEPKVDGERAIALTHEWYCRQKGMKRGRG